MTAEKVAQLKTDGLHIDLSAARDQVAADLALASDRSGDGDVSARGRAAWRAAAQDTEALAVRLDRVLAALATK